MKIWKATGEANCYTITSDDNDWLITMRMNGVMTLMRQEEILEKIVDALNTTDYLVKPQRIE